MANNNLNVVAQTAGLTQPEKDQVSSLSNLLNSHQTLMAMPQDQAQIAFNKMTPAQQQAHVAMFGGDNTPASQPGSLLGSALHYITTAVKDTVSLPFKALNEVSDFMTRLYRTGAIAIDQSKPLFGKGNAWDIANDKGDKVFSPTRLASAEKKYGADMISVAKQVASGTKLADIIANGTEQEKAIAASAAQNNDQLFQDALDEVNAAKYSPGRNLANVFLPFLSPGSTLYKGISGTFDAAYRIFADPTLALGKAKKAYDAANYALFKIAGSPEGVAKAFANDNVVKFFDAYGAELNKLGTARKAGDATAAVAASTQLRRLAPEFGPAAQDEFIKAGVRDAATARNYLQNHADVSKILQGQPGRVTPLIPRLDLARQARVAFLTTTDKVFNIDKVGQKLVSGLYGDGTIAYEDITTGLNKNAEVIAGAESKVGKLKQDGSYRLSFNQIQGKIDRFSAKFTAVPYFKEGIFDVMANDAATQVYRVARLANTRYHSRIIAEAFAAGDEGQKKQIFTGLWNTVAEIRGASKSEAGKSYMSEFAGKGLNKQYSADILTKKIDEAGNPITVHENPANFNGEQLALFPYQLSSSMVVPSIAELDRISARSGLINRMLGISHKKWAEDMTSWWSVGTIAGPKFPARNAAEDLMLHIAVGDSTWGVIKGRFVSTKLRQVGATGDLGFINKLVMRKKQKAYQAQIDEAIANGDTKAIQTIMAKAVTEDGLPSKVDQAYADRVGFLVTHGNIEQTLIDVSEGGKSGIRASDQFLNTTRDVSRFGTMKQFIIDGVKYKAATGDKSFTQFNPVANRQNRIGWLVQLGITSNDSLAKIAVKGLSDDPVIQKKTIDEMAKFLDELPAAQRNRFQSIAANGVTTQEHAARAYASVKNLYSKADGSLNEDLWNKVAKVGKDGERKVSTADLRLEDLPATADLAPTFVHGPTLIPVSESQNMAASLVDKLWDGMGEANARFSREPIVMHEAQKVLADMHESGYFQHYMDQMTAGLEGKAFEKATEKANAHLATVALDLAKNRVLAYVDNPAVRSQLAMSVRNFARFYRATEDFYRRVYRAVRYNPEAITRASLTYEGIAHSGFVQTDDNGDQYFFYGGLNPVYKVMSAVGSFFGMPNSFQIPMPLEFGAKLKMMTPSLNPDSLFPTFSGPLASFPIKLLGSVVPQVKDIEQYLSGSYGQDQPLVSALLPAHINRAIALLSRDERNSQYASAFRKAATYLEATGHSPKPKTDPQTGELIPPSAGELADYQDKLQSSTLTVLALRFAFGFVAPASPQVTLKSDMAKWVRDNGATSYKQVFNQLLTANNGDIDKTTQQWIEKFPNQMPYTVSESESNTVAQVRAVTEAGNWIKTNQAVLSKYPQAGAFLIPQAGSFDFNSYKVLFADKLKQNKTMTDFLREVSVAKDREYYYEQKANFDDQLAMTTSVDLKRQMRQQFNDWATQYKGARPLLEEQLGMSGQKQVERTRALDDMRLMLNDKTVKTQPQTRALLKKMLDIYDNYTSTRDMASTPGSNLGQNFLDMLKQNTVSELKALGEKDPNANAAYNSLFAGLMRAN